MEMLNIKTIDSECKSDRKLTETSLSSEKIKEMIINPQEFMINGKGAYQYDNGFFYDGSWNKYKRDGHGFCKFISGITYEGD